MMSPALQHMAELLVHHYNEAGAISRAAAAKGFGLDPYQFAHPYPGSTNITIMGDQTKPDEAAPTTKPKAGRRLLPWLLAAGIPAAALATWLATRPADPVAPVTPGSAHLEYEVYERVGNEPWKKSGLTVEQVLGRK